jgi:hypothetical protein
MGHMIIVSTLLLVLFTAILLSYFAVFLNSIVKEVKNELMNESNSGKCKSRTDMI